MLELRETRRQMDEEEYETIGYDIMMDGEKAGVIGMMVEEDTTPYCELIEVNEDKRNCGIGTQALQMLAEIFGEFDLAPDNEDARRLYERLGEEVEGGDNDYADQGYGIYRIW